jgi:aminomethyltransferase
VEDLTRTPLEAEHRALNAKLGPFAGWSMPIEFGGVLKEHRAVREAVGIFDLTHLGKIEVRGRGALHRLQRVLSNDLSTVEVGSAQYSLALNERGGIVDDLIAYRTGDHEYLVVPNAANIEKILGILSEDGSDEEVEVAHRPDLVTLAVQGPRSADLLGPEFEITAGLPFMHCAPAIFREAEILVARSGYTGERGYELFVSAEAAPLLWRELLAAGGPYGIEPCGLGARDTLRLEMGYPLHGTDISEERTPLEAMLSWAVAMAKGDFTGREALARQKEEGVPGRLRGLRMEGRLIPRPHYPVMREEAEVGETTSGTFSPTLRVGIALAYLDPDVQPGQGVEVDIRGRRGAAEVVKPPFVGSRPR